MDKVMINFIFLIPAIIVGYGLAKYFFLVYSEREIKWLSFLKPVENGIYQILKIKQEEKMNAKKYFKAILTFSIFSFLVLFFILLFQTYLPWNPNQMKGMSLALAFQTTISYLTNTNWQNYAGETQLSYFSQSIGLTVQNFLSAAVGISVLFALFRGITNLENKNLGNFWKDLTRITLYCLLPLAVILSILLVAGGVVQTFSQNQEIQTLEGETQIISLGPVASQLAIKQLGTNGGGFFGTNSSHPFENPNLFTNWLECVAILVIPIALVFLFGKVVKEEKQGFTIFITMLFFLLLSLIVVNVVEQGNLEGKEIRLGDTASSIWSVFTTVTSNGSVNSMHDSYHPISNAVLMMLMAIGEVVFGGVGSGLYTMIGFVLIAVFISGLMVGRTPEYLKKKIDPHEMKMSMLLILVTPLCILTTASLLCFMPNLEVQLTNTGAHSFSEIFYTATSTGANNGSAMAGFHVIENLILILLGLNMLVARFLPMYATLYLAESLGTKKQVAQTAGTLKTTSTLFVTVLILVIVIVGALSFLPAISLGPIAEAKEIG